MTEPITVTEPATEPAVVPAVRRRTQAERTEESGRRLLAAATELIAERGWEATTAAEIGRRAGYSRAMVHARFGSKDELLDILLRSEYEERLSPDPDPDASGMELVVQHFERMEALAAEDPRFLVSMFVLSFEAVKAGTSVRPRIVSWLERIANAITAGLQRGMQDGSVRSDVDVAATANEILSSGFGIAYGWIALPERFDLPRELGRLRERIVRECGGAAGGL